MSRRALRALVGLGLMTLLSACSGLSSAPETPRQALRGLAASAATGLLKQPPWPVAQTPKITVLLGPAEVAARLPISAAALNEALGRALLSQPDSPHVLDWVPAQLDGATPDQWLLQASLSADAPPLVLSDRTLQPYRLRFDLTHVATPSEHWQWQASGALDLDALPGSRGAP
ncbi:hypothetical protein QO259_19645 [Salinicola sp. JS01]|uniref:hypothetical protein n=1 Tax=Salinicola sp. JS01 TaxID=3050071 RepID=UPI00255C13DC|nr:hypothetical protein [Salinicola sp. JS01]WIX32988.1 hypothetical protein QO259_19645 [Salinicola sp. JS01]